ncbi:DUF2235 domain-containing protein [Rhodobacter capsulatus]|uniref:DUF2235 domain-containing protein n=1 Tax=Rhodobacter capsulatus TaxID=1061 RepID=UPI004026C8D7
MVGLLHRVFGKWRQRKASSAGGDTSPPPRPARGSVDHVVLLDGTLGSLSQAHLTSIGMIYRFLRRASPRASVYYGKGLQYREWRDLKDIWLGWGVEAQILRAYGWLAMRYRPGDRIFLIGYSRGAFAARSLAGLIERVGLLRKDAATERNVEQAWRHYRAEVSPVAFRDALCHPSAPIEMVGVFDTVAALGVRLPLFWTMSADRVRFHDHRLGRSVRHGFQALALHETRPVLSPLLWNSDGSGATRIEQVWFRGCHADVGGQLADYDAARPLSNIPLVWMLEQAEALGLALPAGWQAGFPCDPAAPSVGSWGGWGKFFIMRQPRRVGVDGSERLHESVRRRKLEWWIRVGTGLKRRGPKPELALAPYPAEAPMIRQVAVPRA